MAIIQTQDFPDHRMPIQKIRRRPLWLILKAHGVNIPADMPIIEMRTYAMERGIDVTRFDINKLHELHMAQVQEAIKKESETAFEIAKEVRHENEKKAAQKEVSEMGYWELVDYAKSLGHEVPRGTKKPALLEMIHGHENTP